jgi:hypothetical protein
VRSPVLGVPLSQAAAGARWERPTVSRTARGSSPATSVRLQPHRPAATIAARNDYRIGNRTGLPPEPRGNLQTDGGAEALDNIHGSGPQQPLVDVELWVAQEARSQIASAGSGATVNSTCLPPVGSAAANYLADPTRYGEACRQRRLGPARITRPANAVPALASRRAEQGDPGHRGRPDPAVFAASTLSGLPTTPIGKTVAATRLPRRYCSLIRLGKRLPHARHWTALEVVVADRSETQPPSDHDINKNGRRDGTS